MPNENGTSVLICYYKWRVIFFIETHTDTDNKWQKNLQKGSLKKQSDPQEI